VANRVIDALEVVQIEQQHGDPRMAALRFLQGLLGAILQQHTVRQAGQRIVVGEFLRLGPQVQVGA